jgi:hypothetical protein
MYSDLASMGRWSIVAVASWALLGCTGAPSSSGTASPSLCSRLHREIADANGQGDACGPDVTQLLELTAVGNGALLARRRFGTSDDVWQLSGGVLTRVLTGNQQVDDEHLAALTLLPGPERRVLVTDPRNANYSIYTVSETTVSPYLRKSTMGAWPDKGWRVANRLQPWAHEFLGLEDGNVLDRDLADGSTRVWHLDVPPGTGASPQLTLREELVGAPRDAFTRGHRLVYLSPGRLLEWAVPVGTYRPGVTASDCSGAAYAIWSYSLGGGSAPGDPFGATPSSSGCWNDIDAGYDILGDGAYLFVRKRQTGELSTYAVDPTLEDPLGSKPLDMRMAMTDDANALASPDWIPPTRSPKIKRLVLILQDGRSFDSYFGRYCEAIPRSDGMPAACDDGPACCETIPDVIAGGPSGCVALDADPTYAPDSSADCMRDKIAGGAMSGYATAPPPCGDPKAVACAGAGDAAGAVATYRDLAGQGALADRMFQSFAYFLDGGAPAQSLPTDVTNLLYLGNTHFNTDELVLDNTPFLTTELGRLEVAWALYAGNHNLSTIIQSPVAEPEFHDPSWYPYRSLESGELERDIALNQLPYVSIVLPDATDLARGEGPGHSPANGIAFVKEIVDALSKPPYADDTLVVVTYLTAGGFFDHVSPPHTLDVKVDAIDAAGTAPIPYGPRVPLLALGNFTHAGHVSHVQLELSSLAVFIEWNWLHATALKGVRVPDDVRSGRDTVVNNIGSLLDATATGEPHVPVRHDD